MGVNGEETVEETGSRKAESSRLCSQRGCWTAIGHGLLSSSPVSFTNPELWESSFQGKDYFKEKQPNKQTLYGESF